MKKTILTLSLCAVLSAAAVAAPVIDAVMPVYDFGSVIEGIAVEHTFVLTNTGDEVLEISGIRASCGCTTAELSTNSIEPGEFVDLEVLVDTTGSRGTKSSTITVYSNDPAMPTFILRVTGQVQTAEPHHISASDAYYLIYLLIDLRSVDEYNAHHILGSVNILPEDLVATLADLPQETFVILYDESGDLSEAAAVTLRSEGFAFVHTMLGGFNEWIHRYGMKNVLSGVEEYDLPPRAEINTGSRQTYQLLANELDYLFYLYIDVRAEDDYAAGHIMGAINIPLEEIESWSELLPGGVLLITYDQTGSLGDEASQWLISNDFLSARSMLGGLNEWIRQYDEKHIFTSAL